MKKQLFGCVARNKFLQPVRVIFCPGMGNGRRHGDQAYAFWQELDLYYDEWVNFANGGQDFNVYDAECPPREHPSGLPRLDESEVTRLKDLVLGSTVPCVLFGFSAGAYLCMRVAMDLADDDAHCVPTSVLAMGHGVFAAERVRSVASSKKGIILIGGAETVAQPYVSISIESGDSLHEHYGYMSLSEVHDWF